MLLLQGKPEIDSGSKGLRETWMLLEYADRGNLDRALIQRKFTCADGRLDLVRSHRHPIKSAD